jgi:hypothetical protein
VPDRNLPKPPATETEPDEGTVRPNNFWGTHSEPTEPVDASDDTDRDD